MLLIRTETTLNEEEFVEELTEAVINVYVLILSAVLIRKTPP